MSSQPQTPVWFITGASSGFGDSIAREALSRGHHVVATARSATKLQSLASLGALTLSLDVTADDAAIKAVLEQAVSKYGTITHVINCAGYILEGAVEEATAADVAAHYATNVFGTINVTRLALPYLRSQKHGVVANFGSLGSWRSGPGFAYYSSTKWAVSGFTEGLHEELKPFGVAATVIEPGYFRTGFLNSGGGNRLKTRPMAEYEETTVGAVRKTLDQSDNNQRGDVSKAGKVIVDVLTKTGVAEGREIPVRLALGPDCVEVIRGKCQDTEKLLQEWEGVAGMTDHE